MYAPSTYDFSRHKRGHMTEDRRSENPRLSLILWLDRDFHHHRPSMSARAPFVPQSNAGGRPPSRVAQTPSSGSGHEKPFNTNGLRRSTAGTGSMSQDIHDFNRPRRVLAASQIHRPSTTEPSHHHTAPGLQIAAPAPRNAPSHNSLNEVLSSASHPNFKIPSLPSHTTDDLHTHEAVTLSVPLSDNAGPRRVLVETSGGQHSFPIDVDHDTGLSGDALRSSRRSKRSRAEFDSANESQHIEFNSSVHQSKKFKPNPDHKQTLTEVTHLLASDCIQSLNYF